MRTCTVCGRLVRSGSRCEQHPNRWRAGSTRAWRAQRARVIARDGGRCTHLDANGERCTATAPLEVHHLVGGSAVIVADHLLATRCRRHNPRGG